MGGLDFQKEHLDFLVDCEGDPHQRLGSVHTPLYRTSTIVLPSYQAFAEPQKHGYEYDYGRNRNPTADVLADAVAYLHQADHALLAGCGQAAFHVVVSGLVCSGERILACDNIYGSSRRLLDHLAKQNNIAVDYVDVSDPENIACCWDDRTRLVVVECVGSLTMEVADIAAIARVTHQKGGWLAVDNTWGVCGLICQPFLMGADVLFESLTKYPSGTSEVLAGVVCTKNQPANAAKAEELWDRILRAHTVSGHRLCSDDAFAILRGLHSLPSRLTHHWKNAQEIMKFLKNHPLVTQILCPADPDHPDHRLWQQQFHGAHGLLSFVLNDCKKEKGFAAVLDDLSHWSIGYSWGGYESLITPILDPGRTFMRPPSQDAFRISVGLGAVESLQEGLDEAFKRYQAA